MTRLSVALIQQRRQQNKAAAARKHQSLKDYAVERLLPMTEYEKQAIAELQALLLPRIERAQRGEVSAQSFDEIVEEALRADDSA